MASQLAPGFLVATPSLLDPDFKRSVVLLVDHRAEGSLGFIVNRPSRVGMRAMMERLGLAKGDSPIVDASVLVDGPVAPHTGWVVFEPSKEIGLGEEVVQLSERLAVSASRELLEKRIKHQGPERMLLVLGYAGWGPAQLDSEIAQGAWIPVDLDERIVFDTAFDDRWSDTLRILGIDPARLSMAIPPES